MVFRKFFILFIVWLIVCINPIFAIEISENLQHQSGINVNMGIGAKSHINSFHTICGGFDKVSNRENEKIPTKKLYKTHSVNLKTLKTHSTSKIKYETNNYLKTTNRNSFTEKSNKPVSASNSTNKVQPLSIGNQNTIQNKLEEKNEQSIVTSNNNSTSYSNLVVTTNGTINSTDNSTDIGNSTTDTNNQTNSSSKKKM
ncbi:MAG: hypothetical protein NKF70_04020 [Methanobacterium sp. ERen5]|nr:MAG: hypothetical protein NKF70_04020 [Methanobacterium sp. ERen5]